MNWWKTTAISGLLGSIALGLAGCDVFGGVYVGDGHNMAGEDMETVMGGIDVGNNAQAGDLATVNGGIEVGHDSAVGELVTVNGGVRLGRDSSADSIETVNGGIDLAAGAEVEHGVETVNGSIELNSGARVGGDLANVNGAITLSAATVAGNFDSVNGELRILDGSKIGGRLRVGSERSWFKRGEERPVRVTIGANSEVGGPLVFQRPVELWVHESATIGEVEGAEVQRYSGDRAR